MVRPLLLLSLLLPVTGVCQNFHLEKITELQGLSDNRVTCFLKDTKGFMWIGTENGLNRYDGHTFRIYRPGQAKRLLSHEHVNDIEESNGLMWIATWGGLSVLNPDTDSLTVFTDTDDEPANDNRTIPSRLIWDTYIDKTGTVWLAADVRDLCAYDPATQTFRSFPWLEFVQQNVPLEASAYKSIHKIARKSEEELWLGTTLGLFSYHIKEKKFHYYGGQGPEDLVSLHYDTVNQRVYFGQQKLFVLDRGSKVVRELHPEPNGKPLRIADALLLPSIQGLWAIDRAQQRAVPLPVHLEKGFSLQHEGVSTTYRDGPLTWIGTRAGVALHDAQLDIFPFRQIFPDTMRAGAGHVFHVLDRPETSTCYVSSFTQGTLTILHRATGRSEVLTHVNGERLRGCTKIYEDNSQRIWLLGAQSIFVSDTQGENFRKFPFPEAGKNYRFVDMIEDAVGNFWFASLRLGVFHFDSKNKTWKLIHGPPPGLYSNRPTALLSDPKKNAVWIGDFGYGIFRYDLETKTFRSFNTHADDAEALQSSLINDLAIDREGDIWIATTSGGVSCFRQKENKFVTFTMKTGLPENTLQSVRADINGNIWLASRKGLTCLTRTGTVLRHYDQKNGLPFSSFSTPFSSNNRGELMIGIAGGFLKFHPDSLRVTSSDFPIVITGIENSKDMLTQPRRTRFTHRENEFTFQFAALTFSLPHQVNYFYRLDGYETSWATGGNLPTARYTNLSDGQYTFRVKAVDHTGKTSVNEATYTFTITPPFWKQGWFLTLLFVVSGGSLFSWIANLQRNVRTQKIVNQIATSLYSQSTLDDIFRAVATNYRELLSCDGCAVYLSQKETNTLTLRAWAKGEGIPDLFTPPAVAFGEGLVGRVATSQHAQKTQSAELKNRTEIAVPIVADKEVFGVIYAVHKRSFNHRWHVRLLQEVAAICSAKVGRYFVEDQVRSKVARDLHDDMGSTLSSIQIMSNIALEKKDSVTTQNYLRTIRENANAVQESMNDMVWAINPENDTMEKVIYRMKEFAAEILEPLDIRYVFREDGDFESTRLNLTTRKDLFLIFKEAVNNAAKYSACREVCIELQRSATQLELVIRDNGKGFDLQAASDGNGLRNMKSRAQLLKANLTIRSSSDGTEIRLRLPIT